MGQEHEKEKSMFPGVGAEAYYNEAGEPLGWDYPSGNDSYYCDWCGWNHSGDCEIDFDDEDADQSGTPE